MEFLTHLNHIFGKAHGLYTAENQEIELLNRFAKTHPEKSFFTDLKRKNTLRGLLGMEETKVAYNVTASGKSQKSESSLRYLSNWLHDKHPGFNKFLDNTLTR